MLSDSKKNLTSVVIVGGGVNSCLMALLIKERLKGVVGDIHLLLKEGNVAEVGLLYFSSSFRWLHQLLGIDERELLRRGIIGYTYGANLSSVSGGFVQEGAVTENYFLSREITNIQQIAGPWFELIHHARQKNQNMVLDALSLAAIASREGRFLDPDIIGGAYASLSVSVVVDAKSYMKYLLELLCAQQIRHEYYGFVEICYGIDGVYISLDHGKRLDADLVIDLSSKVDQVSLPEKISRNKKNITSGNLNACIHSSLHALTESIVCPVVESIMSEQSSVMKIRSGSLSQNLYIGESPVAKKESRLIDAEDDSLKDMRHIDVDLHAPFWVDNYVCFAAADYSPWDPCWTMWDWVRDGMLTLIELWPDKGCMSGFADEFNRVNQLNTREYFELAAAFCELRGEKCYFSNEIQISTRKRIELYSAYGVVQDSESQVFSAEYWSKIMLGAGIFAEKPAGIYSDFAMVDFTKKTLQYSKDLLLVAARMPTYKDYINYLLR